MKFSILIAHYNNFEYFKDCYKSILDQTFQDFEVIIVDDCSTDSSFEKVKELVSGDSRFKIFQNEENKGVGYTKGKLIELASGDICGILDPDDILLPNAIQIVLQSYSENPNIIATYSKFYICDENMENCKIFPNTKPIKNQDKYFFNINLEVAHFFTFKREVYSKIEKIEENYKIAEDQDLYMKLYEQGDFFLINQPIFKYRLNSKGLSHNTQKSKQRNEYWHNVLKNTLKRRNISTLYGKNISEIENLPKFIFDKKNNLICKIDNKITGGGQNNRKIPEINYEILNPSISVIMSVYNAEKYLRQSIESILNQSFSDFEFIIIEDCSTDNSLNIIKEYAEKDPRIKLIQKSENKKMRGFIENLNIGIKKAKGKYIARMDADDISYPNRFEKQIEFLEKNPKIFMVGSSINFIDENNNFIKKLNALKNNADIQKLMPKKITMYHPVIMFRNEQGIEYREKIYYCEDYDFYLRLMLSGKKFANIDEPLMDYRILHSSISRKDNNDIKTLFIEKMKSFYHEKKKKGTDSYDSFNPDKWLNITNETSVPEKDLEFAMKVAVKFGHKNLFSQINQKYRKHYKNSLQLNILSFINLFPNLIKKIYFKISPIY